MRIFFVLALVLPLTSMAQTTSYGDFRIVNSAIVYQRIFDRSSVTLAELDSLLKTSQGIGNVTVSDGSLSATLTDFIVDYKKFEFPQVSTPPIIQTGRFSGKITAEVKDGRYRITFENITMKGDIGYKEIPAPEPMTNYACIKGVTAIAADWCRPNMLGVFNQALNDCFTYTMSASRSDW